MGDFRPVANATTRRRKAATSLLPSCRDVRVAPPPAQVKRVVSLPPSSTFLPVPSTAHAAPSPSGGGKRQTLPSLPATANACGRRRQVAGGFLSRRCEGDTTIRASRACGFSSLQAGLWLHRAITTSIITPRRRQQATTPIGGLRLS